MSLRRSLGLAMPAAGILAAVAFAGSASAATPQSFGCRASVARVSTTSGAPTIEPFVANPMGGTCQSDTAGATTGTAVNGGGLTSLLGGGFTLGPTEAVTTSVNDDVNLSASSQATVSDVSVPTPAGAITVAGTAQATASYSCVDHQVIANASSSLGALSIGANEIALPSAGAPETMSLLGALGQNLGSISVNQNTVTASSDTEDMIDVHVTGVADMVIGEAQVTQPGGSASPCSGVPSASPTGPTGRTGNPSNPAPVTGACPAGSTLDAGTGECVIFTGGGAAGRGRTAIAVSPVNSSDIAGAKVISLSAARKLYPAAACLSGGGPKFVVVGTKKADKITVKTNRYRVLGLAGHDTITVKGGKKTCVDAGTGKDRIVNKSKNKVSAYGAAGNDTIVLGNGPALVKGGAGADHISAGNGKVTVWGGVGGDVIKVGTGHDTLIGGAGNNRITARGRFAHVSAGKGKSIAWVRKADKAYAHKHGVKKVNVLA
jgi:Ca2+-binding RTX toxin-like protein